MYYNFPMLLQCLVPDTKEKNIIFISIISADGITFRQKVMEEVGCKPSYWNSLVNEAEPSHICNTSLKLQKVYDNIRTPTKLLSTSPAPCTAMLIPHSVQKDQLDDKGKFDISIIYSTTEYQEIENHREYDFNSMFAGIGGFVGIFCGYSLFQVTDLRQIGLLRKLSTMFLAACSSIVMVFSSPLFGGKLSFQIIIKFDLFKYFCL